MVAIDLIEKVLRARLEEMRDVIGGGLSVMQPCSEGLAKVL